MLPRNAAALAAGSAGRRSRGTWRVRRAKLRSRRPGWRSMHLESAMDDGWYEDFAVGKVFRTPGKTLSEAEIL